TLSTRASSLSRSDRLNNVASASRIIWFAMARLAARGCSSTSDIQPAIIRQQVPGIIQMHMSAREHEVVVIGGGPAGSSVSNFLARAGVEVVVLERKRFPRFRVGESLLPTDLAVLERLGVDPDGVPFLRKRGAVFIDERSGRSSRFSFDEGLPGTPDHAHQVERAVFDHELLRI